jgi:putative ABC transport system ATP-binding protein
MKKRKIDFVIELVGIEKNFEVPQLIRILKHIDLKIPSGEWLTLMGPSGSGKSTLLSILAGLDLPTAGEVWIAGSRVDQLSEDLRADFRSKKLGFVFQSFRLLPHLTARENIELPLIIRGEAVEVDRVNEIARAVGLLHRLNHFPGQMSGGEQQRVALARALIGRPEILLADEPTGNLDSKTGREILDLMKKLQAELGCTLVVVTHDPIVQSYSDRVVQIRDGMIGE